MDLSKTKLANLISNHGIIGLDSCVNVTNGILVDHLRESMKENRAMKRESAKPGKRRPLRPLLITEKIEAIDRVRSGETKASVARDIGVPESTLRGWCKTEAKIRGLGRNSSTHESEAHSTPVPAFPNLEEPMNLVVREEANGITNSKKMDEALWMWLLQQESQVLGHQSAQQNNQLCQDGFWFWQSYKQQCGFPASAPPVTQSSAIKKSPCKAKAMLDSILCNNNNENVKRSLNEEVESEGVPATSEEALEHGEKFFKWLDKCSDPSVTRLQLMQFKYLLDNLDSKKNRTTSEFNLSGK